MRGVRWGVVRCAMINTRDRLAGVGRVRVGRGDPGDRRHDRCGGGLPPAPATCADRPSAWTGDNLTLFVFLDSGEQVRRGLPIYDRIRTIHTSDSPALALPNLNHPLIAILVTPLTFVARPTAYLLWVFLSLLVYAFTVALVFREINFTFPRRCLPAFIALVLTYLGVIYALQTGQLSLLLSLPVVLVWLFLRRGRVHTAAMILGVLIVLKPFLGVLLPLFLVRGRWRALFSAGVGGAGVTVATLPFVGVVAYPAWLITLESITWYDHPLNLSFTGWFFRLLDPDPPSQTTWLVTGIALFIALVAVAPKLGPKRYTGPERRKPLPPGVSLSPDILRRRIGYERRRIDRDFGVLIVVALLGSPLGWLYYTPMIIPALATRTLAWRELPLWQRYTTILALICLWLLHFLPSLLPSLRWIQLTIGASGTYGMLLLAITLWFLPDPNHRPHLSTATGLDRPRVPLSAASPSTGD